MPREPMERPAEPMTDTALTAEFITAWHEFRAVLEPLCAQLRADDGRPAWAWRAVHPHQAAADAIANLFFEDDQDAREVRIQPALIGVTTDTLRLAHALNARRSRVKRALMALDRRKHKSCDPLSARRRRRRLGDVVLEARGLARLHRVQLYREVHVLDRRPDWVGFLWARTRRVERISVAALRTQVQRLLNNPPQAQFAQADLDRLRSLRDEDMLALVEAQPCHARANVAWAKTNASGFIRRMLPATLPLVYPAEAHEALPKLKPLPEDAESRSHRAARTDRKLEQEPFLATVPAYRYRRCAS